MYCLFVKPFVEGVTVFMEFRDPGGDSFTRSLYLERGKKKYTMKTRLVVFVVLRNSCRKGS